ncbi:phage portal protein [Anaerosacchariphilus polymeriproducens]|uniref:Phage portal protein n=1 Tax=Anaerosacchariphilus polymeriproducens TaxID=1812858 RepID=A0A371AT75_9FIRM|nr:phage portal protein [Anaerosacchariphilus polymeriproducens]RDU22768.1 phage portal protein [Anaerosacchariphilus polymeriproducens]
MGLFKKKQVEERADVTVDDVLLSALIGTSAMTKETALNIPSLNGCIEYVANTISMLPIKLYKESNGKVKEVKDDARLRLLNDETGDTLDSAQFWKAMIRDYYLGKGGYAYIRKEKNKVTGLYYVDETQVSINKNTDPIFKDYSILVHGNTYKPFQFLKILRNTKDGCKGTSITEECPLILSVGYATLKYEETLVKTGGNKKGFVKAANKLTQEAKDILKEAWRKLYSNNTENVVILDNSLDFKEASNTSVEMQLNENKQTNAVDICKIMQVPENIIKGTATESDYIKGFKMAVMPVLRAIECALNKDFLLEKEKESFYFAFDTKELLKGDIKERYASYSEAVKAGWITKNEIRYIEDKPAIEGLDVVTMSLGEVIYDVKNKTYFTPNTKTLQDSDMNKAEQGGDKDDLDKQDEPEEEQKEGADKNGEGEI